MNMIKKIFTLTLKLIPLITLYKGFSSGSERLKPLLDMGKIVTTQYEISQMKDLVIEESEINKGELFPLEDLTHFLNENFQDDYSLMARNFFNTDNKELAKDLWGSPYKLLLGQDTGTLALVSMGPDKEIGSSDDIGLDLGISPKIKGKRMPSQARPTEKVTSSQDQRPTQQDSEPLQKEYDAEGFDQDGLDLEGFDREGFDREGYDREGFDREGYDRQGNKKMEREEGGPQREEAGVNETDQDQGIETDREAGNGEDGLINDYEESEEETSEQ